MRQPGQTASYVTEPYILLDNFNGTGAITDHLPDVYPTGSSYIVPAGSFGELSGGYLPYVATTNYGETIINLGVDDYLLEFRANYTYIVSQETGGMGFRSKSDGDLTGYIITGYHAIREKPYVTGLGGTFFTFDPTNQGGAQFHDAVLVDGNFYTWKLYVCGTDMWLLDENDNLMLRSFDLAGDGNNYAGQYTITRHDATKWDWWRVSPWLDSYVKTFNVMGDSISNSFSEWPGWVACGKNGGMTSVKNHAVPFSTIISEMDTQTDECEADLATCKIDYTIIALGNNDASAPTPPDLTAEYQENLIELYGTLGKPIYCMATFDWLSTTGWGKVNANIQTAITNAVAVGVDATYWDTGGWLDPLTDLADGIHPNAAGSAKIATEILALLP